MTKQTTSVGSSRWWQKLVWVCLLVWMGAAALEAGLELRRWAWEQTEPVRFGDIFRGYRYGRRAATEGYLDLYDKVLTETRNGYMELDYAPLRLLTMKWWVQSLGMQKDQLPARWQTNAKFNEPIRRFNAGMELVACVGIFLLIRHWMIRNRGEGEAGHGLGEMSKGVSQGTWGEWTVPMLGAMFFWFNPAVILSAYGWPTWDVWIIPFYVWAVYLACRNWWWASGLVLGLGALFKGQQLIVAPFFVLWPLFMKRPGAAVKWGLGLVFAVAMVVSVWMLRVPAEAGGLESLVKEEAAWRKAHRGVLTAEFWAKENLPRLREEGKSEINGAAVVWVVTMAGGYALVMLRHWMGEMWRRRWRWVGLVVMGWMGWEIWRVMGHGWANGAETMEMGLGKWAMLAAMTAGTVSLAWWLPKRYQGYGWAGVTAGAILLCVVFFQASTGWLQVGWAYGQHHWQWLTMGKTDNLPGLLTKRFGWENTKDLLYVFGVVPAGKFWIWPTEDWKITTKTILSGMYLTLLVLCAWGGARYAKAGDKRFLVAMVSPWVMMFAVLGQMHERYLVYAAGVGACLVGVSLGFVLMVAAMSAITWIMTMHVMLLGPVQPGKWTGGPQHLLTQETAQQWLKWIEATHPDLAWMVLVIAGVFLYVTLQRPRRAAGQG